MRMLKNILFITLACTASLPAYSRDAMGFCSGGVNAGKRFPGDLLYPNADYPHFHCFKGDSVSANTNNSSTKIYFQPKDQCKWTQDDVSDLAQKTPAKPGNLQKMVAVYNQQCDTSFTVP